MNGPGFVHESHSLVVKGKVSSGQLELYIRFLAGSQMHTSKAL